MSKFASIIGVLALGITSSSIASGQAEETPRYSRDYCVKVREGKAAEYSTYLHEFTTKLAQVRVDSGHYSSFVIVQAVVPAGRTARCDYHLLYGSIGFPPETPSPEQTEVDMKKAGISASRATMIAQRDQLSYLVSADIWRSRAASGLTKKGAYARLNYYKTKPGMMGEWLRMETQEWKPLADAAAQEMGTSWGISTLVMPGGDNLPYNAISFDGFPTWEALGKGIPARTLWNKVHPQMDLALHTSRMAAVADRPRVDIVKAVEVIRGK